MRAGRLFIISAAVLLVGALLVVCFAPLIVAGSLRIWAQRAVQREGLRLEIGEIDAPLLRPVIIRNARVRTDPGQPIQIDCSVSRLELGLNLAGIFTGTKRPLRHLRVDGSAWLSIEIRSRQNLAA